MKKKVLIVEDVADVRAMMKILVECYGYQAITADDGYEAIEKIRKYHPDLVLMDLMMPVLDGIVATQIIRNLEETSEIPIIALTASVMESTREACRAAGIDHFLAKPVEPHVLRALLAVLLAPDSVGQ